MSRFTDLLFGRRDVLPTPFRMIGFPSDGGGLVPSGVTTTTALGLSPVWRSLDILSNGVSQLPWLERRGNLDLPPSRIVLQPQSQRTRREWVSLVVSTLALFDVCYLLKVGEDSEGVPISLLYIDPSIIMPATTSTFSLLPPTEFFVNQQEVRLDQLVILHRSPQPGIDDALGGIIKLARMQFATYLSADGYASRYWQAGGAPTTVLETEANLNQPESEDMKDRWMNSRRNGPDRPAILTNGLKAKSFGADPTEQSAVEARKEMVADIGRYFGIPTHILNSPAGDTETYSSTESGNQDLVRYTLRNYIGAIEDAITSQLPGGRHMVMDPWQLTSGTMLAVAQSYQLASGGKAWLTPDEIRERTGYGPIEDPDELNPPAPEKVAVALPAGGRNDG